MEVAGDGDDGPNQLGRLDLLAGASDLKAQGRAPLNYTRYIWSRPNSVAGM